MKILGLTGGIASGKSSISDILEKNGGYILDADIINHNCMKKDGASYNQIISAFGISILDNEGEINRRLLGKTVFSNKEKLSLLEEISHRHVVEFTAAEITQLRQKNSHSYAVIDAPLLIEAGMHEMCDEVWLVYSDIEKRIKRLNSRNGLSRKAALERVKAQTPFEALRPHAAVIIENNGTLEELERTVLLRLNSFLKAGRTITR